MPIPSGIHSRSAWVCLLAAGLLLAWVILPASGALRAAYEPSSSSFDDEVPDNNLLQNPGFEGNFTARVDPYDGGDPAGPLGVAEDWELWYDNNHTCPPHEPDCTNPESYNRRPEYKGETSATRVHAGVSAQKMFTSFGTHTAGFHQAVTVPAQSWVRLRIWVVTWSSDKDIPAHSFKPGYYGASLGIDVTGGTDWRSADIAWTVPITRHDEWVLLETTAFCPDDTISVWTRGTQLYPVKHNDSYWDDAELVVLDGPPEPTPTVTPTATHYPTPDPTPGDYTPEACPAWRPWYADTFAGDLARWGSDPTTGSVAIDDGALRLRNGPGNNEAFPIAWLAETWPAKSNLRLSFRFAFSAFTGYGSSIGIGSETYEGERSLAGNPDPYGINDILEVHHRSTSPGVGRFEIELLDTVCWAGTPADSSWHTVTLELRALTYILWVDGVECGRAVSYMRPRSLYLGNPVIVWDRSTWTEVALDDLQIVVCDGLVWAPLILGDPREASPTATETVQATPEQTLPVEPTPSATPTGEIMETETVTPTATTTVTPEGTTSGDGVRPVRAADSPDGRR